jgi:hypothetical protein
MVFGKMAEGTQAARCRESVNLEEAGLTNLQTTSR